jgi:hypothetical protein
MVKQKKSNRTILYVAIGLIILALVTSATGIYFLNSNSNSNSNSNKEGTLRLTVSNWSGWSEQQPSDEVYSYKISNNYQFSANSPFVTESFIVKNISNEIIEIILPKGVVPESGEGISLSSDDIPDTLIVNTNGEEIKAITQTMDAGTTFTFKYIN